MPVASAEKNDWVKRVLGVTPRETGGANGHVGEPGALLARWTKARNGWQAADEAVGQQINGLAAILRSSGDPDLATVADTGLMTVTAGFKTKMMAALMDIGTDDMAKLRKRAAKTAVFVDKLQAQIESDARVIACDESDFGVPVTIRATLGRALGELSSVLAEAAKSH